MKNGLDLIHELVQENNNEINSIRESIFDRLDNAKYHYNEYINLSNVKNIEALKLAFLLDKEEYKKRIALKANIIACIYNIHAIYDYLANLIFYCLKLDMRIDYISFFNVIKKLENTEYKRLYEILNNFKEDKECYFMYINDISNHTKHKYIIQPKANTSNRKGDFIREMYFIEFSQKGSNYEKILVDKVLNNAYNNVVILMKDIGEELYCILKNLHLKCR